jgi:adenosylmethionine-8-amino-7-oxononanoate aminotransferase
MSGDPDWLELDVQHVWHPYTQHALAGPPLPVVGAEGVWLELADGRRILDAISSWWLNVHGHNHPRLNAALRAQAAQLAQVIFAGFSHEAAARLAAELIARAPAGLSRVFYSDDGSTAVEVALKMCWQLWRNRGQPERRVFVALEHAYHGDTFGAMAASGVAVFHQAFADLLFHVERVRVPGAAEASELPSLDELLARRGHQVAAVIVEPMLQGAGGMRLWPASGLAEVRQLTRTYGIPLIADEVLTGFGRTGALFACNHASVSPDVLCLSKALTGGMLPLGATLASEEIFQAFWSADRGKTLFHGHSYTGNALACAVARESLAIFDDEGCLDRIGRLEAVFEDALSALAGLPLVQATRCLGGMAALDLAPRGDGGYLDALGPHLHRRFLDRGVLLRPLGNTLYLLPPYAITDDEVRSVMAVVGDVLADP